MPKNKARAIRIPFLIADRVVIFSQVQQLVFRPAQANTDIFFAVRNVIRVVELAKKSRPYIPQKQGSCNLNRW